MRCVGCRRPVTAGASSELTSHPPTDTAPSREFVALSGTGEALLTSDHQADRLMMGALAKLGFGLVSSLIAASSVAGEEGQFKPGTLGAVTAIKPAGDAVEITCGKVRPAFTANHRLSVLH